MTTAVLKNRLLNSTHREFDEKLRCLVDGVFFRRLGREGARIDVVRFLDGFEDWRQCCSCDGERDARCIPLHVFSPGQGWTNLHDVDGVKEFEDRHGRASSQVDDGGRGRKLPNALHGQQVMVVGTTLRSGFRWDVVSPDGGGQLYTSTEIWRFGRGS